MVAIQLKWANLESGTRVLELGSGSGYLVSLLSVLTGPSGHVVGLEVEPTLVKESRRALSRVEIARGVEMVVGVGDGGYPTAAPYDRILVSYTVSPPFPHPWRDQLAETGPLVVPVDRGM